MSEETATQQDQEIMDDAAPEATETLTFEDLEAEIAVLKDRLLRSVAETENVRRRAEQERKDAASYGAASLARDLLDVADNFDRALAAASQDGLDETNSTLLQGVRMIQKELLTAFERNGIRKMEPVGERFDPNKHQAIAEAFSGDFGPGVVLEVAQAGFEIGDRVLRAAAVVVSRGQPVDGGGEHLNTTA